MIMGGGRGVAGVVIGNDGCATGGGEGCGGDDDGIDDHDRDDDDD